MNLQEIKNKFLTLVRDNIKREGIEDLLEYLEKTDFYTAPASSRFHCCHEGGLVEHSINVFENLKKESIITSKYSMETIALVSLFHDLCKVNFYKVTTRNVKKNGQWFQEPYYMKNEQYPFGHGEKSVYILMKYIKLTDEEALAINWHMGGFDSRQSGDSSCSTAFRKSDLALELHISDLRSSVYEDRERVEKENVG